MLISCAWLNELLEGEPITLGPVTDRSRQLSAEHVAERLTSLGLEVEGVSHFDLPGVIVGEIQAVTAHPKADKLHVVQLFDGRATVQVVCGASNLPEVGGKVAFAPVGTTLPGGLEIAARPLRGVDSQGMICSEAELDIGSDADGIMVLPQDWAAGALLHERIVGVVDSVIEISVTPNRPDALGHVGVAIDLAVALEIGLDPRWAPLVDRALSAPAGVGPVAGDGRGDSGPRGALLAQDAGVRYQASRISIEEQLVTLAAPQRCGRYLGFVLEQVRVGRSPEWLRVRLHRVGLRAINDVVDITNYVLMETGQPLHAFDRTKLDEGRVVVRMASEGEPMITLDGAEITLTADDLVIADARAPQALAGVMGGAGSAVASDTHGLLLEVAWFEPRGVRRTARRHGFHTDSSHRFERGVDPGDKLEFAAERALELLRTLCGARVESRCEVVGQLSAPASIDLRPAQIGALLGMPIDHEEAERILVGLGVGVERIDDARWSCTPPSFRPDLEREVDLIEEVMRHHGLDDLPAEHSPASEQREAIPEDPLRRRVDELTDALRGVGLHEHLSLSFTSEQALASCLAEDERARLVRLRNPLRAQAGVMRAHMLPGLLDAVALNHARHDRPIDLFEVGRVYAWPSSPPAVEGPTAAVDRNLPSEQTRAAVVLARHVDDQRAASLVTRACIDQLARALASLGVLIEVRAAAPVAWLHPGVQAGLWHGGEQIGLVGELHPDIVAARELAELELAYAELWVDRLPVFEPRYVELARFPSTARDLSLDLRDEVSAAQVVTSLCVAFDSARARRGGESLMLGSSGDPRAAIETVEEYRGVGLEPGRRALLLRLHYRAAERSVTDSEVQELHDIVVEAACAALREADPAVRVR
jgi:phenylalanyl-tRNA synthetase beta chain